MREENLSLLAHARASSHCEALFAELKDMKKNAVARLSVDTGTKLERLAERIAALDEILDIPDKAAAELEVDGEGT